MLLPSDAFIESVILYPTMGRPPELASPDASPHSLPSPGSGGSAHSKPAPNVEKQPRKYKKKARIEDSPSPTGTHLASSLAGSELLPDRPTANLIALKVGRISDGRSYTLLKSTETDRYYVKVHKWSRSNDGRMQYATTWYSYPAPREETDREAAVSDRS